MPAAVHCAFSLVCLTLAVVFLPSCDRIVVRVGSPAKENGETINTVDLIASSFSRTSVRFECAENTLCEGWVYLPRRHSWIGSWGPPVQHLPPVVLLSSGLGGQKDFGLHEFAASFASAGLAAFVFDYRGWGGSDGWPRHWLSAHRNLQDLRAAVAYVRSNLTDVVDTDRLMLLGNSFSGGLMLELAAQPDMTRHIAAVVVQMPYLEPSHSVRSSLARRGLLMSMRMLLAGLSDLLRTVLLLPPLYLPIVGPPGSAAFLEMDEQQLAHYFSHHPAIKQGGWTNMARAIYAVEHTFMGLSPIRQVHRITAPVLYLGASLDEVCPLATVAKAAALTPKGQLFTLEADHYSFFSSTNLPTLITTTTQFFWQHASASDSVGKGTREQSTDAWLPAALCEHSAGNTSCSCADRPDRQAGRLGSLVARMLGGVLGDRGTTAAAA